MEYGFRLTMDVMALRRQALLECYLNGSCFCNAHPVTRETNIRCPGSRECRDTMIRSGAGVDAMANMVEGDSSVISRVLTSSANTGANTVDPVLPGMR